VTRRTTSGLNSRLIPSPLATSDSCTRLPSPGRVIPGCACAYRWCTQMCTQSRVSGCQGRDLLHVYEVASRKSQNCRRLDNELRVVLRGLLLLSSGGCCCRCCPQGEEKRTSHTGRTSVVHHLSRKNTLRRRLKCLIYLFHLETIKFHFNDIPRHFKQCGSSLENVINDYFHQILPNHVLRRRPN
jgi:hypothetical protein